MSPGQSQSKLLQRQKQIDYGKNTVGYEKYLQLVPKSKRGPTDPKTPNIYVSNLKELSMVWSKNGAASFIDMIGKILGTFK